MSRLVVLGVLATALAACGDKTTAPGRPRSEGASRETGLAAFEQVRSVFQHARCQNCHPAGDIPLQGDDGRPHAQNVQRGPEGRGNVGLECTTCHQAANAPDSYGAHMPPGASTGWRMPPPQTRMVFVGMSAAALCEQIKDTSRNGGRDLAALRTHLDDPLVAWAWNPGVGRTPLPLSRQEFLTAFETWTAAGAPCP
ncbi:MAG TPA: hypothetical protein VLB44_22805 [Kofleriaceae bacterium]|nr:hypothetical protein [Kofleriaceae bacterium]